MSTRRVSLLRAFIALAPLFITFGSPCVAAAENFCLEVRSAKLKAAPNHWSASLAEVNYGDTLEELSASGAWRKVRAKGGAEGYLHESALTRRTVVLRPGAERNLETVDAADIVLAGKGFCDEVSAEFELKNRDLDFKRVDEWSAQSVSDERVRAFLVEGELNVGP